MNLPNTLSTFIQEKMTEHRIPGVSVGILHGNETQILPFGVTSIKNPLPVTEETLFQIGSNTKTMTATVMMLLAEQGKLDLDATIRAVLPDFRVEDEATSRDATIRHLLTHSTGWVGDHFIDTGRGADAVAAYVASMADLPQLAPQGFAFSYNNSAFAVAGRVIEVVTNQSYEQAMREMLFEPLGMNNSFFEAADVMVRRFAVGHQILPDEPVTVGTPWPLPRAMYAAGAVAADAIDMLTYAQFYLDLGITHSGEQHLSKASTDVLWTPQFSTQSSRGSVAHSWFVRDEAGVTSYSHGGATVGQMSAFKIIPDKQFAFVSLTNGSSGGLFNQELEGFLLKELCQIEEPEPALVKFTDEDLAELAGRYSRPMVDIELSVDEGKLIGQVTPKQGFPTKETPPRPPLPPHEYGLLANGDLRALDGPIKGAQLQILRQEDGRIGWIRGSMRLHRKE